jgi:hypothetical protein
MVGKDDQITMQNNYIKRTAGRSPALSGKTLLHAVNNVWEDNNGHAIEGGEATARGIFEGNVFINVKKMVSDYKGRLFTAPSSNTECQLALGRACETNLLQNSQGGFDYKDTSFFSEYSSLNIAPAVSASKAKTSVPQNAGAGKIDTAGSSAAAVDNKSTAAASKAQEPKPAATQASKPATEQPKTAGTVALYAQCGGQGYTGATTCAQGKCVKSNDWYSQCL